MEDLQDSCDRGPVYWTDKFLDLPVIGFRSSCARKRVRGAGSDNGAL
ncbi:MAG: hypothetical protein A4E35_01434 [Methanoregula sp. PtaU1.Bin051]|nr:MAG: hypothetical protein A4E35_01434 [Methanoregula sp. PtaU1.Bin051]